MNREDRQYQLECMAVFGPGLGLVEDDEIAQSRHDELDRYDVNELDVESMGYDALVEMHAAALEMDPDAAAQSRQCQYCWAKAGQRCVEVPSVNGWTAYQYTSYQQVYRKSHWVRQLDITHAHL